MKELYTKPEVDFELFEANDIITTSQSSVPPIDIFYGEDD